MSDVVKVDARARVDRSSTINRPERGNAIRARVGGRHAGRVREFDAHPISASR